MDTINEISIHVFKDRPVRIIWIEENGEIFTEQVVNTPNGVKISMNPWNEVVKPCVMIWEAAPLQEIVSDTPLTIEIKRGDQVIVSVAVDMHTLGNRLNGVGIQ